MLQREPTAKRATNLSLNAKVLDMARELGMNLSQTVDTLLAEEVRRRYWERWNADNKGAFDAFVVGIDRALVVRIPALPVAAAHFFRQQRIDRLRQIHAELTRQGERLGIERQVGGLLESVVESEHGEAP